MRRAEAAPSLRHAVVLGLVQGPAELLPISSSAHTALIPWLAGWPYAESDPESRKSFEVALHGGAGLALALVMGKELAGGAAALDRRRALVLALSLGPAALAGYTLRGPIERRLGGPRSIAAGLLAGGAAMALADSRPATGHRPRDDARAGDGLALGIAQSLALIPGVSRNGATLTAARARGFGRADAQSLSWGPALPLILGAGALEIRRLRNGDAPREMRGPMAAGAVASFLSTLVGGTVVRRAGRDQWPLLPYSLYRFLLAGLVIRRLRRAQ
ncbi:MAG: Bacitracin resistance protein BacA [Solirubrobacterales bacterium]|nr:Bacitracin resistance protein BacA [Solirubrobacterales bacterium]